MSADTTLMPIPGPIDPVPVPRAATPRADGKVELVGLPKDAIRIALEEAGMEPKQAKLRAKQIWHWVYNRGVSDFSAMTDIAKAPAALAGRALHAYPAGSGRGPGVDRRHAQMAASHPRRP